MSVETLGAFLTALNTIMLIRILFNDLHQIREMLYEHTRDYVLHNPPGGING